MKPLSIKDYMTFINELKRERDAYAEIKNDAIDSHWETINKRLAETHKIDPDVIVHGGWTCENSATGLCYYNDDEDPCNDFCLVCGGPSERK